LNGVFAVADPGVCRGERIREPGRILILRRKRVQEVFDGLGKLPLMDEYPTASLIDLYRHTKRIQTERAGVKISLAARFRF
jgi:hypothetical protein